MDNDTLLEVNPYFEKIARERGFYSRELMDEVAAHGSIRHMDNIPEDVREVFVTAHDVLSEWHIRMQAAFQKHTDNAVSKTVNLPREATVEDVRKVYDLAYELGCKGVTIYRDGSKENQVLSFSGSKNPNNDFMAAVKDRPETLDGFTTRIKTGLGQLYVTVTEYAGLPFEVGPQPRQARQQVLQLRQFHLQTSLSGVGVLCEYVQDQRRPVQYLYLKRALQVTLLRRRKLIIKDDDTVVQKRLLADDLLHLPLADVQLGVRVLHPLTGLAHHHRSRSGRQHHQLLQGILGAPAALLLVPRLRRHQIGALRSVSR